MSAPSRAGSTAALLLAAVVGGAIAALAMASFVWAFESLIELVWTDLPDAIGVDPYRSWYLFVVPAIGGVLVGLGQKFLGNQPRPLGENIAAWRAGGHVETATVPATICNSLAALAAGGPLGFEAALVGLIGGIASWISRKIGAAGSLVRQAWGAERVDERHGLVTTAPYWIAAVSSLFIYRSLPFGELDFTFRFDDFSGHIGVADGLLVAGFAAAVAVPIAWAMAAVGRAETATLFGRSPVAIAVAGGIAFAAMAWVSEVVLFSGQQNVQRLITLGNDELAYITVAKWAALVVALLAGWRGGPIFPMFTAVAALAVLADALFDIGPNLVMVAGIAAVSLVMMRGSIPIAFILTLYAVPLTYSGVILVGCVGATIALAVGNALGLLPATEGHSPATTSPSVAPVGINAPALRDVDR